MLGRIRALGKFGMGETVVYVSCPVVSRNLHGVPLGGGGKQANNWDTFLGRCPGEPLARRQGSPPRPPCFGGNVVHGYIVLPRPVFVCKSERGHFIIEPSNVFTSMESVGDTHALNQAKGLAAARQ
jgi:hypothetical protein